MSTESKFNGQLLVRTQLTSLSGGDPRTYRLDKSTIQTLGQGKKVFFMFRIYSLDASCEVVARVYHGCIGTELPADYGPLVDLDTPSTPGVTSVTMTTATVHHFWTAEDLMAFVELTIDVRHATPSATVKAELEVWATVITAD
ncbi:hypothetical protein L6R53_15305 [Myxococcota bacterium]|nr:hypothetical protein [Myxococcota bacterium]